MRLRRSTWEAIPPGNGSHMHLITPSPDPSPAAPTRPPSPEEQPPVEPLLSPDSSPPPTSISASGVVPPIIIDTEPLPATPFPATSPPINTSELDLLPPPTNNESPTLPYLSPTGTVSGNSPISSQPSSYHTAHSTTPPPSLLPAPTEFLQLHSENPFSVQDLLLTFPLAVRIWTGVSHLGGAVARLDFQRPEIAGRVLEGHGGLGREDGYQVWAEMEGEEEWWEGEGTVFWRGIRWFCESGEGS